MKRLNRYFTIFITVISFSLLNGCSDSPRDEEPLSYKERYESILRGTWLGVDYETLVYGGYVLDTLRFLHVKNEVHYFERKLLHHKSDGAVKGTISYKGGWNYSENDSALYITGEYSALWANDSGTAPLIVEGDLFEKNETIEFKNDTLFFTFVSSLLNTQESNKFVRAE